MEAKAQLQETEEVKVSDKGIKLKCYRRTAFPTMEAAKAEAARYVQFEAVPYQCRWCKQFHVFFT